MEYTKGGWYAQGSRVYDRNDDIIAFVNDGESFAPTLTSETNAQRIVDCVNGCEGFNPKAIRDLYEACKTQHDAIDRLFAELIKRDETFFPTKSGHPWEAIIQGNKAIAKAEGGK